MRGCSHAHSMCASSHTAADTHTAAHTCAAARTHSCSHALLTRVGRNSLRFTSMTMARRRLSRRSSEHGATKMVSPLPLSGPSCRPSWCLCAEPPQVGQSPISQLARCSTPPSHPMGPHHHTPWYPILTPHGPLLYSPWEACLTPRCFCSNHGIPHGTPLCALNPGTNGSGDADVHQRHGSTT